MRLSPRGRMAAASAVVGWAFALTFASLPAAALGLMACLALAWGLASLSTPSIEVERRLARSRFTEGEAIVEGLRVHLVRGRSARVTLVEASSEGLAPPSGDRFETVLTRAWTEREVRFEAKAWGAARLGPLTVIVQDAWGFFQMAHEEPATVALSVTPRIQSVGKFGMKSRNPEPALGAHAVPKPGDSSEFFALRNYMPGDSIRSINWKATARAGTPIVNQQLRDTYARVLAFVDLREKETWGSRTSAPWVLNGRAAASILSQHERLKDHLTILTITDGVVPTSKLRNPRLSDMLDALSRITPGGGLSTEAAIRSNLTLVRPRSPTYLFTSGALDHELVDAVGILRALGAKPFVVSPRLEPPPGVDPDVAERFASSRGASLQRLRAMDVPVAEWSSGQTLEVALLAT